MKRGDKVIYRGCEKPECGVVVHVWSDQSGPEDCYVAFFGDKFPEGKPTEKPYLLRYYSESLEATKGETESHNQELRCFFCGRTKKRGHDEHCTRINEGADNYSDNIAEPDDEKIERLWHENADQAERVKELETKVNIETRSYDEMSKVAKLLTERIAELESFILDKYVCPKAIGFEGYDTFPDCGECLWCKVKTEKEK